MQSDDDDGMMTIRVPRDSTVLVLTGTAEGEVTKAADVAAANAAAETKE